MADATNYLENALVNHVFRNTAMTSPTTVYVKLHTNAGSPGEDAAANAAMATEGTEAGRRKAVTFNAPTDGQVASSADVTWTNVSDSETYGYFSIWDDASAGNPLCIGALTAPVAVTAGDNFTLTAGNLTVQLS